MAAENVLTQNLAKYVGQWVVICGDKVIAHDKDLNKIESTINSCQTTPTIAKIPKKETLIF